MGPMRVSSQLCAFPRTMGVLQNEALLAWTAGAEGEEAEEGVILQQDTHPSTSMGSSYTQVLALGTGQTGPCPLQYSVQQSEEGTYRMTCNHLFPSMKRGAYQAGRGSGAWSQPGVMWGGIVPSVSSLCKSPGPRGARPPETVVAGRWSPESETRARSCQLSEGI